MNVWVYLFAFSLILELVGLFQLSNVEFYITIGSLNIKILSVTLLLMHILLHGTYFGLKSTSQKKEIVEEIQKPEVLILNEMKIKGFEKRFNKKSTIELEEIVEENFLIPEAVAAAKRILSKR